MTASNFKGIDTDTLSYYPLQDGKVPASSVGMKRLSQLSPERRSLFQLDRWTSQTLKHKAELHQTARNKHFAVTDERPHKYDYHLSPLYTHIVKHLVEEYPSFFTYSYDWRLQTATLTCILTGEVLAFDRFAKDEKQQLYYKCSYNMHDSDDLGVPFEHRKRDETKTGFEALALQIPEDLVFYAREGDADIGSVAWAHLMSPAGWSAEWALGKSFTEIHAKVNKSDGTPVVKHPAGMISGIMRMRESVERVGAISFRTCFKQNLHPDVDPEYTWTFDDNQELYIRFERQTVTPIPELNGFLFTVRPYYANLLNPKRIDKAIQALENIDDNSYYRNLLQEHGDEIVAFLKQKRDEYEKMGVL